MIFPTPKPTGRGLGQKKSGSSRKFRDGRIKLSNAARTKQRKRLWEERVHVCEICEKTIWTISDMELDHKIPKGLGGGTRDDADANQRLTHTWCNRLKGSKRNG